MKRLLWIFFALCVLILLTFLLLGDQFDTWFSLPASRELLSRHRDWAGPLGAVLLISDLLLPIPTTVIIGAMGAVLGIAWGAFWGWIGLTLAGLTGYGLARWGGDRWRHRLSDPEEQKQLQAWFESWGGLAVILSRMLPILPEAISVTAGLSGMRFLPFLFAVALGSIPPAIAFAWMGKALQENTALQENPGPALWIPVGLMGLAWCGYIWVRKRPTKVP